MHLKVLFHMLLLQIIFNPISDVYAGSTDHIERTTKSSQTFGQPMPARALSTYRQSRFDANNGLFNGESHVWLYDFNLALSNDFDDDGYFTSISLNLDLDSLAAQQEIFIDISLVDIHGHSELLFTSQDFLIYGDSKSDTLRIESNLSSGFSIGHYDLVLEVFDASNLELVAQYDAQLATEFGHLPLESNDSDGHYEVDLVYETRTEIHGGSMGLIMIFCLTGFMGLRRLTFLA